MSCFLKLLNKMLIALLLVTLARQTALCADNKRPVDVSISLPSTSFEEGNPIRLHLSIRNNSEHLLLVRRDRPAALTPIVITSPDGKLIPVRHPATTGGRVSAMGGGMQKGESYSEVVDLHKWFMIEKEGSYNVRYEMRDSAGKSVSSDTITFTVTR